MASFSSLFQDNASRTRCDSDVSNVSDSSKRKARDDYSPVAKNSRIEVSELSGNGNSEDNLSSEKNLTVLEEMINRVQAIFEKLKVNIEEADLNPKLAAILTDKCSALTITNSAQVDLIGLAKSRKMRTLDSVTSSSTHAAPRSEVRNPPAGLAAAREFFHSRAPL